MGELKYSEINQALLAALGPLREELGVRTLETYGGEFSLDSFLEFAELIDYPAIFVYVPGFRNKRENRTDNRKYDVYLFAADQNLAGEEESREGDDLSCGTYALLESAREKIDGKTFWLGAGPVDLQGERIIGHSARLRVSVGRANYQFDAKVIRPVGQGGRR